MPTPSNEREVGICVHVCGSHSELIKSRFNIVMLFLLLTAWKFYFSKYWTGTSEPEKNMYFEKVGEHTN